MFQQEYNNLVGEDGIDNKLLMKLFSMVKKHLKGKPASDTSLSLYLADCNLGLTGALYLSSVLKRSATRGETILSKLSLRSNHLRPDSIKSLAEGLSSYTVFTELDFSQNVHIGATFHEAMVDYKGEWPDINSFLTCDTKFAITENIEDTMAILMEPISKQKLLDSLYLDNVMCGDSGAIHLAKYINSNPVLQTLDVRRNHITARGLKYLAVAISQHKNLSTFHFFPQNESKTSDMRSEEKLLSENSDFQKILRTISRNSTVASLMEEFIDKCVYRRRFGNHRKVYQKSLKRGPGPQRSIGSTRLTNNNQSPTDVKNALQKIQKLTPNGPGSIIKGFQPDPKKMLEVRNFVRSLPPVRSPRKPSRRFRVGWAETIGRRDDMQDAFSICGRWRKNDTEDFFGLYDGHGGKNVSGYCSMNFHKLLQNIIDEAIVKTQAALQIPTNPTAVADSGANGSPVSNDVQVQSDGSTPTTPLKAKPINKSLQSLKPSPNPGNSPQSIRFRSGPAGVKNAGYRVRSPPASDLPLDVIDSCIFQAYRKTHKEVSNWALYEGTTSLTGLILDEKLIIANIGDTRAVLSSNSRAIRLSRDHKPSDADEKDRIAEIGGFVTDNRVNGMLAVSRALGDAFLGDVISPDPAIFHHILTDADEFLILACDGIWDVIDDQTAVDIVSGQIDPDKAAKKLVKEAYIQGSLDNISCIIIFLK